MSDYNFIDQVTSLCDLHIKDWSKEKIKKGINARQRFNEYFTRLVMRAEELEGIDKYKATQSSPEESERTGVTLHQLQLIFVDKTEAFHQQVYATLSAFILVLSTSLPHEIINQMPITKLSKFLKLNWLSKGERTQGLVKCAEILEVSRSFRSKYIDHTQQHVVHDWMTVSINEETVIIYFVVGENPLFKSKGILDPRSPDFWPPIACEEFYVSPPYRETIESMKDFVMQILVSTLPREKRDLLVQVDHEAIDVGKGFSS